MTVIPSKLPSDRIPAPPTMRDALLEGNMEAVRQLWSTDTPKERGQALAMACEFHKTDCALWMLDMMAEEPFEPAAQNALVVAVQKNQYEVIKRMAQVGLTGQAKAALTAAMAYQDATSIALLAPVAPRLKAVANLMEDSYDDVFKLSYEDAMRGVDRLAPHLTAEERQYLLKKYEPDLLVQTQAAQVAADRASTAGTTPGPARKARARA